MTQRPSQQLFPRLATPDDGLALEVGEARLSARALVRACAAHFEQLERDEVRPGDRVAVWTQRSVETPVALVAHALAGVVSVPLNPALGDRELQHILSDSDPKLVLAADPDRGEGAASRPLGERTPATPVRRIRLDPQAGGGGSTVPARQVDDAPVLILYTSGTTGAPKGAVISAANVAANLDGLARAWAWGPRDVVVHALPLFHVHGLVLGLFGSLRAGGALAWVPRFDPVTIARTLDAHARDEGESVLFAVPTMVHRLADAAESDRGVAKGLGAARLLVSGSAALPLRDHARIEAATGRPVVERYGLTETLINCAVPHDAPAPGYVGPPLEGIELRLVDDGRRPIDATDDRTIGEVAVRGPSVFLGYLNRPDATDAVRDADGWFYTGDLATRRPDGAIRIVGRRATDLIKTGGFKVGAGEVEGALLEDSGVAEAAVIGLPDEDLGERIVAFVVPRDPASPPSAESLSQRVADALAPHKRPREVRFVEALPRNAMGKVMKPRLREG